MRSDVQDFIILRNLFLLHIAVPLKLPCSSHSPLDFNLEDVLDFQFILGTQWATSVSYHIPLLGTFFFDFLLLNHFCSFQKQITSVVELPLQVINHISCSLDENFKFLNWELLLLTLYFFQYFLFDDLNYLMQEHYIFCLDFLVFTFFLCSFLCKGLVIVIDGSDNIWSLLYFLRRLHLINTDWIVRPLVFLCHHCYLLRRKHNVRITL